MQALQQRVVGGPIHHRRQPPAGIIGIGGGHAVRDEDTDATEPKEVSVNRVMSPSDQPTVEDAAQ